MIGAAASVWGPLAGGLLLAAPTEQAPTPVQRVPAVVVAERRPQARQDVAGSISVIDRDRLERLQARDIEDAVRYEPGVVVPRDTHRFGAEGFNLRGLQGNRVQVRVDGVPLAQGFSVGSFANAGRDQIAVEWIERVEILRGPASALYGSDALAGVVAIQTLDPLRVLRAPGLRAESSVNVHGADRGRSIASWAVGRGEHQAVFLGLQRREFHEQANHPLPTGLRANPVDGRLHSGVLKWSGDTAGGRLTVGLESYRTTVATDVRSLVNGPGQFATTERLLADDHERRDRVQLQYGRAAAGPMVEHVELRLYGQDSATRQMTWQWRRAAPPVARHPTLRERRFDLEQTQYGIDLALRGRIVFGAVEFPVGYGFEWNRLRVSGLRDGRETNLSTGSVGTVILGEHLPVRDFPDSSVDQFGLYWTGEVPLGSSRFHFVPALRYDQTRLAARADALFREDFPALPVVDRQHHAWTPKLALRFAPSAAHRMYLAYNEGFRAPPFSDVNIALSLSGLNYVVRPNPSLRPERSRGFEFGWNASGPLGELRLAVFDNRYRDLIESRVNLGPDTTGAVVFQSLNRSRARVYGGELAAELELGALREGWAAHRVRAGVSWARGSDRVRRQPLNSMQPDRAIFGWLVRTPIPALELEWIATAVAPMQRVDRSAANLYAPPGHVTWDVQVHYEFGTGSRLDLGLYNFTDQRYWSWSALRGVVVDVPPGIDFYTAPGRHAALRLTWAW